MRVLGIDTSGYANAIGVVSEGKVLSDFVFEARTDSLQKIVSNIDAALKSASLKLTDIDGLGVGLGPGSWTGIRVGVTVGKILAYATGKPVCGIPTLEALAYGAGDKGKQILSIISVGTKDTVYAAFYRAGNDNLAMTGDYYVGDISGLAAMINEPTIITGPEVRAYAELIKKPGISVVEGVAKGVSIAILAGLRFGRGESDNALALTPMYLKESTAKAFTGRYREKI
ncbi:MAG: tRNA (adenosine(37)-N6)-threonylcarbamoyltransferase complex dimerization subunit type 1 TsaB [Dehalococcoidales bacterium]|nr:tRNA (adenosine(37)-N6)-threonylcarbamoyltransferase complex dimerization subunit type 1 TsaB [Dehalococcoidales bacterium]